MRVNQQQIANRLNLSVATVSRSLKNDRAITANTRNRVIKAAREMGYYSPLVQAPITTTPELQSVCAMIQSDATPGSNLPPDNLVPEFLSGMSHEACNNNASLMVHYVQEKNLERAADWDVLPPLLRSRSDVGVILVHRYPENVVKQLTQRFPCVSINHDYRLPHMDHVEINQVGMMTLLVDNLNKAGHRRIGFVGSNLSDSWGQERFAGYVNGINRLGLPVEPENFLPIDSVINLGEKNIAEICSRIRNGLTALVCANDAVAYTLIKALKENGIKVPHDVSVTGFDAIPAPAGMPVVHSIRQPMEQMGAAAMQAVLERMRNPMALARRILFDGIVVTGETIKSVN